MVAELAPTRSDLALNIRLLNDAFMVHCYSRRVDEGSDTVCGLLLLTLEFTI